MVRELCADAGYRIISITGPAETSLEWRVVSPSGLKRLVDCKENRGRHIASLVASVAESVDAADSKSVTRKGVPVRVGPEAPQVSVEGEWLRQ
jgi:hypothetical protein